MRGQWNAPILALLSIAFAGCFKHPGVEPTTLKCATDDNCPTDYVCAHASRGALGTCARLRAGSDDAGIADARMDVADDTGNAIDSGAGEPALLDSAIDLPVAPEDASDVSITGTGGVGGKGGTGGAAGAGGNTGTPDASSTGGVTGSGSAGSGGAKTGGTSGVGTGGTPGMGGIGSGGAPGTGGTGSGGAPGTGGIGSGGAPGTGGIGSGGAPGTGGNSGGQGGTADAALPPSGYQGPCDVLGGGCAEAYGMARAMTAKYTGPLFQLGLAQDTSRTLDIGQTSDHKADMTTWSDFCGGTESNCVVSKIYAQIHSGANDLQPSVWRAPWGPDCSAGGYTCAAKFTIESATSLPILATDAPQEYAIRNNNVESFATGVNGGTRAISLMYNGKPVANQAYCCGVFGLTHKYNAGNIHGTNFMVALAHGWKDPGGCCIAVNCGGDNKYCVGAEEDENNDLYDYGTSAVENAMVVTQFDPTSNAVITYLNGTHLFSQSPPKANLNAGTAIHLGGGGDLSQPDPVRMREALVTNDVMNASEVTAMKSNITAFFSTLNFP